MKIFLACFVTACLALTVFAQDPGTCYTTEMLRERIRQEPKVLETRRILEEHTRRYIAALPEGSRHTVRIIPVVFHIVHNYGQENISDAQVLDAVRILNEDFRKLNPDTASIVPAFQSIAADCQIEFRLANIDPNGNCTNGIDRIVSPLTENADDFAKLNPWPEDQYLNIW